MKKLILFVVFALAVSVQAQWIVQQINLKTGWNAVCLKVNLPDATCAEVFNGKPVETVSWWCSNGKTRATKSFWVSKRCTLNTTSLVMSIPLSNPACFRVSNIPAVEIAEKVVGCRQYVG